MNIILATPTPEPPPVINKLAPSEMGLGILYWMAAGKQTATDIPHPTQLRLVVEINGKKSIVDLSGRVSLSSDVIEKSGRKLHWYYQLDPNITVTLSNARKD